MEDKVIISLDKYDDLMVDNRRANYLDDVYNNIRDIVGDDEFNIEEPIHNKIYVLYEEMSNKQWY